MNWIIEVLLGVGFVAFIVGIIFSTFSKDSKVPGTSAWKRKHILMIIAGFGFFALIGCVFLWDFLQEQQTSNLISGLILLVIGSFEIWNSINELRQTNPSSERKAYADLILGTLLTVAMASLFVLQYQNDGSISFQYLFLTGFGIHLSIVAITKVKQIKSAPSKI